MPLPCDQVLQWMFQHAPPGYRCLHESRLAALRADKPERLLYTLRQRSVKPNGRGNFPRRFAVFQPVQDGRGHTISSAAATAARLSLRYPARSDVPHSCHSDVRRNLGPGRVSFR